MYYLEQFELSSLLVIVLIQFFEGIIFFSTQGRLIIFKRMWFLFPTLEH